MKNDAATWQNSLAVLQKVKDSYNVTQQFHS